MDISRGLLLWNLEGHIYRFSTNFSWAISSHFYRNLCNQVFRTWVKTLHADSACVQVGNVHWPTESLKWNWCLCELCFIYCYTIDNRKWMFCPLHFANETRLCLYGLFFLCHFAARLQGSLSWIKVHYRNEWMNEWYIYKALYCVLLYTQSTLQLCGGRGGSLLNHHQCAASTWMMRRLPQDSGASALTTHQLQVERRESHRANQVDGDY